MLFDYSEIKGYTRFKYNPENVKIATKLIQAQPYMLYSFSIAELFSYYDSDRRRLYINKDYKETGDIILISVTGKYSKKAEIICPLCSNERLYKEMKAIPMPVKISFVPAEQSKEFITQYKDTQRTRTSGDFVYNLEDISKLQGGKWHSSRKKVKRAQKNLTWRYATYEDYELIMNFLQTWLNDCKSTERLSRPAIGRDKNLINFIWKNKLLEKNPFYIVLVFYEGKLDAINVTELSLFNKEWQLGILEKSLRQYNLSGFYVGWLCEDIGYHEGRKFDNASGPYHDMYNKDGINDHKMLFKPIDFYYSYTIEFKKNSKK